MLATRPHPGLLRRRWKPSDIETDLWLRARDPSTITIDTGVSQWADKSGKNAHAVQAVASAQPAYGATAFSGSPGIVFDGVNDFLSIATTLGLNTTHGVFYVFQRLGPGSSGDQYKPSIGTSNVTGGALHYIKNSNNLGTSYPYYPEGGLYDLSTGSPYVNNTGYVMSFQSNTSGWGVWRNGTLEGTTPVLAFNNACIGYTLAADTPFGRYSNLVFSEVIGLRTSNPATKRLIEGYLAWEHGLQSGLDVGHPHLLAPPMFP